MHPVVLAFAAVVVALVIFALLLLLGVMTVHWLRLPTDLPDGPRFEPPAPEPTDEAAGARQRAADHAAWAALGERARRIHRAALDQPSRARSALAAQAEAAFRARDEAGVAAAEAALAALADPNPAHGQP